jgi:hypothetical protein
MAVGEQMKGGLGAFPVSTLNSLRKTKRHSINFTADCADFGSELADVSGVRH